MPARIHLSVRNSNNKKLLANVDKFIRECLDDDYEWSKGREPKGIVAFVNEFLSELGEEMVIEQFKVVCDQRNNSITDMARGEYYFLTQYKQLHCLNTTELEYHILL